MTFLFASIVIFRPFLQNTLQISFLIPSISERYSDYFNPMPDISSNNFSKKLKPDNMIGTLG